ncbi:type 1 glutamine amidotransferase domain-containing protein [Streptomyces sp. NPDC051954]|uniref:type 1 glutamine amidotransferase domain-containing protein n=1 Tax=unclassified Streptomyces TaxID=2593676 RepID=UPI0034285119
MTKILFVVTGATHLTLADGIQHPTGFWAEEVVAPYNAFTSAGHTVVVATPGGVIPAVDQESLSPELNGGQENADKITAALAAITELTKPVDLDSVRLDDYVAVFYPGGHGPMEDLADSGPSAELLQATLTSGKPLGVVCHGAAALLGARDAEGAWLFAGYRITGFTRAEETQTGLADKVKWVLQDRLVESGAVFEETAPWAPHVVVDRTVITGQNPASSAPLAAEMLKALG